MRESVRSEDIVPTDVEISREGSVVSYFFRARLARSRCTVPYATSRKKSGMSQPLIIAMVLVVMALSVVHTLENLTADLTVSGRNLRM
jgi:hypothetical protein